MGEVEKVALWAGLLASVVSTVLSIVAIWFAVHVNSRSENVSDQTIKSLQKIESFVQRLSEDNSGRVKAARDKMLGTFKTPETITSKSGAAVAKEVASGLTAELKSEIEEETDPNEKVSPAELKERYEKVMGLWEKALENQILSTRSRGRSQEVFAQYKTLSKLSDVAQEMVSQIRRYHLSRRQYKALTSSNLGPAMKELRDAGLLMPLQGNDQNEPALVYWFPPSTSASIRQALLALPPKSSEIKNAVKEALHAVGYDRTFEGEEG
jgi:hypothetical protein